MALIGYVNPVSDPAAILALERPSPKLWTYYLLTCLAVPPLFPILVLPMWFRYHTMRYKFTAEGISMSWGILFRREIIIHHARIQDIHLRSNIVERWLGLSKVLVQTASGNAAAEMTLEGLLEFEAVRDFLYSKMRGVRDRSHSPVVAENRVSGGTDDLAAVLRDIAAELRELRGLMSAAPRSASAPSTEGPRHG